MALVCLRCGAPLPAPPSSDVVLTCEFCRVSALSKPAPAAFGMAVAPLPDPELSDRFARTVAALRQSLESGADPHAALKLAAREHLGPMGETDVLARVILSLAADLRQQSGADVERDPLAMARLVEAYLKALSALRDHGEVELNIPFIAATGKGPVDLKRRLTPADVAELAAREPGQPGLPAAKKRSWWPF